MAGHRRTADCERCGRRFKVCRYNAHKQKYCTVDSCVDERRRERQREYYRKKYRQDAEFRASERTRCHAGLHRRRRAAPIAPIAPDAPDVTSEMDVELVTAGLVAQMIDSGDPQEVREMTRRLQRRGQRLAMGLSHSRSSPG